MLSTLLRALQSLPLGQGQSLTWLSRPCMAGPMPLQPHLTLRPPATPVTLPSLHFLRYFQLSSTSVLCTCCSIFLVHFSLHSLHLVNFYFKQDGDSLAQWLGLQPLESNWVWIPIPLLTSWMMLNKLLRSPSLSFLTYMLTWVHTSQVIHVKH